MISMNSDSLNKWLTLGANFGVIAGIVFLGEDMNAVDNRRLSSDIEVRLTASGPRPADRPIFNSTDNRWGASP